MIIIVTQTGMKLFENFGFDTNGDTISFFRGTKTQNVNCNLHTEGEKHDRENGTWRIYNYKRLRLARLNHLLSVA